MISYCFGREGFSSAELEKVFHEFDGLTKRYQKAYGPYMISDFNEEVLQKFREDLEKVEPDFLKFIPRLESFLKKTASSEKIKSSSFAGVILRATKSISSEIIFFKKNFLAKHAGRKITKVEETDLRNVLKNWFEKKYGGKYLGNGVLEGRFTHRENVLSQVHLRLPEANIEVFCNAPALEQALDNLVTDAIKHQKSKKPVEVFVNPSERHFSIGVRGYGVMLSPQNLRKIGRMRFSIAHLEGNFPKNSTRGFGKLSARDLIHSGNRLVVDERGRSPQISPLRARSNPKGTEKGVTIFLGLPKATHYKVRHAV
ncbi:MAG: ATP-binding protein [Candidatus Diapherotrites archaeon]